MTRRPERSPWAGGEWVADWPKDVMHGLSSVEDLTRNVDVSVMHPAFPGWRFLVTFSPGGVPIGFRVEADKGLRWNHWLSGDPALDGMGHSAEAPAITARFLRRLPLGEIQDAAKTAILRSAAADDKSAATGEARVSKHWAQTFKDTRRPGRSGRDDGFYAELAAAYVARLQSPSARPVEDLADQMGYSASQIRNLLYSARRRGLLTSAPAGRPGGTLTSKARALLPTTASRKDA